MSNTMPEYQIVSELRSLVRSGFYTKQELLDMFCNEICESCNVVPEDVSTIIDSDMESIKAEKTTWPAVTDCDRLDLAFSVLNSVGMISLQNAGCTQSDAYGDIQDLYNKHPNQDSVIGYCFYHRQDLERAVRGMGLYVAFGPMDAKLEDTEGPKIGEVIRETLEKQGLEVEWDGTFNTRMLLPTITWKKR
ncbi:DUF6891 domain-containing protein [Leucothrix arctica]|nr:hypothetical protein [Leucothrix arctica]